MRNSILVASVVLAVGFPTFACAASFTFVSGTLHARASATPASSLGPTVTDSPADVTLTSTNPASSDTASASTNYSGPPYNDPQGDGQGYFSATDGFDSKNISIFLSGSSQGNGGIPTSYGSGAGWGSADLFFTLDAPALIKIQNYSFPSIYYFGNIQLLKNGSALNTFGLNDSGLTETLAAGNYELKGSASVDPLSGTGGSATQQFMMTVLPEPASCALMAAPLVMCMRRKRS